MNNDDYPFKEGPFSQDVLESGSLSEKNFIREGPSPSGGFPAWLWLFLIVVVLALGLGVSNWYQELMAKEVKAKPFLDVANRQFSLFLWRFPSFLRANVKKKTGYLTGFQYENSRYTMDLSSTESFVVAPPDLLFLYHTWHRLLGNDYISRPISAQEFLEFLSQVPEWKPAHWEQAPASYQTWLSSLDPDSQEQLENLSFALLPLDVRQAFQGWKNYTKEGPAINQLTPDIQQIEDFLDKHPFYSRQYWRNIQEVNGQQVAGENYLKFFFIYHCLDG